MELSLDRLTKQYGRKIAVDCVSATLKPGVYGLLGANGAGKTTLMRMLCAVLESTSGEVLLDGKEVTSMGADYRNVLGYLPQDFGYYPNYTAVEFLMYIAALKGIPKNVAKKRVTELLEVVDLSHVANKKVKTFSGGMKQRVGIAQALLNNPKILILDEPTAGLDPKERVRFRNLLSEYAGDKIVILSTHIVSDIEAIADEVLLMKKGKFVLQGTVPELIHKANGKVWELSVSPQEARQWQTKTTVANLRHEGKEIILRIISDNMPRACLKNHSRNLNAPLCGIFHPNSVAVAHYGALIRAKYPTNCDAHLAESLFQTRSSERAVPCEATLEDLYLFYFPTEEGVK